MLFFPVFARLQSRPDPQVELPRLVPSSIPVIQPLCFQTLTHSFAQRRSRNSFFFNRLRTLSITTRGCTPLPLFSSSASSPISSISRRPSHFSSSAYKMLLPQLLCFGNDPFSLGVYPPRPIFHGPELTFRPAPLHQSGHSARMLLSVVSTPHRETSPLFPVSKISRADTGCGSVVLPNLGQGSCHQAGRPGSRPG
jgi:hypothetical protein